MTGDFIIIKIGAMTPVEEGLTDPFVYYAYASESDLTQIIES